MKEFKKIKLPVPDNFSFDETLSFLERGHDESLYNVSDTAVSRLIELSDGKAIITICQKTDYLEIDVQKRKISKNNLQEVENYVKEWFDMERDIEPFYQLLRNHPKFSKLPKKYYGSRIVGIPDLFEAICWTVIGQQINLTFAYKLKRRLVEKYGEKKKLNDQIYLTFPTPEKLIKANKEDLKAMQFSKQKIDYLMNVSRAFIDGQISKKILQNCKNKEERMEKLTAIKGVGTWSANYVLMKSIRDMTCITYGDSGLNRAIQNIFKTKKKSTNEEVDAIFKDFKNWESYLNFYLWKTLI